MNNQTPSYFSSLTPPLSHTDGDSKDEEGTNAGTEVAPPPYQSSMVLPGLPSLPSDHSSQATGSFIKDAPPSQLPLSSLRLEPVRGPSDEPAKPILYTFSANSFNSMLLVPSKNVTSDASPVYHISVTLNCFMPSSYITTIQRNSEDGEYVADFEMGISTIEDTVRFGGKEHLIAEGLAKLPTIGKEHWKWRFGKTHLLWDCTRRTKICYSPDQEIIHARFTPSIRSPKHTALSRTSLVAVLEVLPSGFGALDHILLSVLILERKRLAHKSLG